MFWSQYCVKYEHKFTLVVYVRGLPIYIYTMGVYGEGNQVTHSSPPIASQAIASQAGIKRQKRKNNNFWENRPKNFILLYKR